MFFFPKGVLLFLIGSTGYTIPKKDKKYCFHEITFQSSTGESLTANQNYRDLKHPGS